MSCMIYCSCRLPQPWRNYSAVKLCALRINSAGRNGQMKNWFILKYRDSDIDLVKMVPPWHDLHGSPWLFTSVTVHLTHWQSLHCGSVLPSNAALSTHFTHWLVTLSCGSVLPNNTALSMHFIHKDVLWVDLLPNSAALSTHALYPLVGYVLWINLLPNNAVLSMHVLVFTHWQSKSCG